MAKRLGTRLRKLKKDTAIETLTATGKRKRISTLVGKNKLTDDVIERHRSYYGAGIRRTIGTNV